VITLGIVFTIFVVSFIALNTSWLAIDTDNISTVIMLKNIHLASMLLLSAFLIANAHYHIKLDGQSEKRVFQLTIGVLFGLTVFGKLLMSYYKIVYTQEWLSEMSFSKEIKAENTIFEADRIYQEHGVLIEYYDFNKTKKIFEPTPIDKEIKVQNDAINAEMHSIPLYLVLAFLVLTIAFWIGNKTADKTMQRKSNDQRT